MTFSLLSSVCGGVGGVGVQCPVCVCVCDAHVIRLDMCRGLCNADPQQQHVQHSFHSHFHCLI